MSRTDKKLTCLKHPKYGAKATPSVDCEACWKLYSAAQTSAASQSKGRARGGGRSSKAKGRNACLDVQKLLLSAYPDLTPADVVVKATSQGGTDLHLSEKARALIGLDIEVKNVEALNIWSALAQSEVNSERSGLKPVVFFKRAFTKMYVALPADIFLGRWSRAVNPVTDEKAS